MDVIKMKKQKNIKDITIQQTNDSSILSKASVGRGGYFNDLYLSHFTTGFVRRAPLINRGYYVRAKAIDHALRSFLDNATGITNERLQIIQLGAGFDSSYFRLKSQRLLGNCRFVEVDFPDVVRRKEAIIKMTPDLIIDGHYEIDERGVLKGDDYTILPCDLAELQKLELLMKETEIRFDVPTLFVSECVLTYVDNEPAEQLFRWISEKFRHSVVVVYEQICPDDPFGVVMMRHFNKIQSRLRRIHKLRSVKKHKDLLTELHFDNVVGVDMNYFFTYYIDEEEKTRMMNLELFDEYEEWHLKCLHYCIVAGFTGDCKSISHLMFPNQPKEVVNLLPAITNANVFECQRTYIQSARFGHRCVRLTNNQYLVSGGFGVTKTGGHARLRTGSLLTLTNDSIIQTEVNGLDEVMHHTMTRISENKFFIIGGRKSPKTTMTKFGIYEFCDGNVVPLLVNDTTEETLPLVSRWRHSTVLIKDSLVIFGGRNVDAKALDDFWCVKPGDLSCTKLSTPESLVSRHSHSMVAWGEETMILYGGCTENMSAINKIHLIHFKSNVLHAEEILFDVDLPARYGHTCHVVENTMYVIGGIEPMGSSQPSLLVLNIVERTCKMIQSPTCNPAHPIMLHNHQTIIRPDDQGGREGRFYVVGGGGNCFSFGTHFNTNIVALDIPMS